MICRNKLNEMITAPAHTSAVNAIDTSGCVGPADGQAVNKWRRLKGSSTGLISSGELQILSAGIIWGSIGIYVKFMQYAGAGSAWCSFLRVAFAGIIMLIAVLVRRGASAMRISRRELFICALLGLVCHGIYNIFYNISVMQTGVSMSAVLLNVAPVFTAVMSAVIFGERISRRKWLLLAVNIAGCSLPVTGGSADLSGLPVFGLICGICSGICYGMTAVIGRLASGKTDALVISAYSYIFAALFLFIWILFTGADCVVSAPVLGWGFMYALIPTALGYFLYYRGVSAVSEVSRVPVLASVECIAASLIGIALFHEKIGYMNWLGIALVIISIAFMNLKKPVNN